MHANFGCSQENASYFPCFNKSHPMTILGCSTSTASVPNQLSSWSITRCEKPRDFALRWSCDTQARSKLVKVVLKLMVEVNGAYKHGRCETIWAKRGVMVSMSAFLACHQCYCVGSSLAWGLNLRAVVCGIFWSSSPGVFSGYSGFLPSYIGLMVQPIK